MRALLCSVVGLVALSALTVIGLAQRQNGDELLVLHSPMGERMSAAGSRQAVPVPGARFDPRQPLHAPGQSTPQANSLADPLTTATLAADTSLSANTIFLEAPLFSSGGSGAGSVAVADVNGDGKPDLLVANQCPISNCAHANGTVGVLLGNGDGTFRPAVIYDSGGENATSMAVADVNGDGRPDLLVANYYAGNGNNSNGSVAVLLGNGDGSFQPAVTYGSGGEFATSLAGADVNGDGKPDLLVANQCGTSNCTNGIVGVLLGNGDGTFQSAASYASGGANGSSVAVADLNGDGKPDLVITNQCADSNCTNGTIGVLLGKGDGTYQPAASYPSGGNFASSIAVADVNGDAKPDLLVANQCASGSSCGGNSGVIGVLLGNGDGTFQPAISHASGGQNAFSVAVNDVNGDGKPDLVVANHCTNGGCGDGAVSVLLGNGDGAFGPSVSYDSGGAYAFAVAVKDVNGDGKPDLVVVNNYVSPSNSAYRTVGVLLGDGDGTFRSALNYGSGGFGAGSIAVADVNRDGKPDLLVSNECPTSNCANADGLVGVLLGNGDGTFHAAVTYDSGGQGAGSVAAADVNGDGKLDLLVSNWCAPSGCINGGTVDVLLGNGDGTFQPAVSYGSGGSYAGSLVVSDVNGDGRPDLLVANYYAGNGNNSNGSVAVLLGNGDGSFQPAVSYGSGGLSPGSLAVVDVNRDGKLDLAVSNYYGNNYSNGNISVLLGNGDGTFQAAVKYGTGGQNPNSAAVADVNGDGVPDLLVTNACAYGIINCTNLAVLFGNGDGTFQTPTSISATPGGGLVLADFNGDGKLDIASSSGNFLLLGDGNGTFEAPLILGAGGLGIAVGDFNRDGKPDLAVGGVTVLLNVSRTPSPMPTITSVVPSTATAGVPAFTLTVNGTNFVNSSQVNWNGSSRATTFINSTQLMAAILVSDIANSGSALVTVVNPPPGGGTSNAAIFTIKSATFSLTVNLAGTGSGTVTSSPTGINCPTICSANFTSGTFVTLTATPVSGSAFAGWSGVCTGTGSCSVTMNSNQSVTATFNTISGVPAVALSTTSLSFSGQLLNTTSTSKSVTLTNSGTGNLLISGIVASGDFGSSGTCPISPSALGAGANCKIAVTFAPTVPGSISGEITIIDNALNSPQLVKLTGIGLAPLSVSPASLSFGTVTVGTTTLAKSVTLSNNLSTALTIAYAGSADYTVVPGGTTPCSASLAAKAKCTLNVAFTPSQNGSINGAITVTYNGSFSPQEVAPSGSGTGAATVPLSFSPSSLSFASQLLGTSSAAKTVTVTNNSTSAVTINSNGLSTTGNYSVIGSGIAPCPGATLAASGGKCTFAVSFSPSINGTIKGAVSIADGAGVTPQIYNLSGTGALPLTFSPASLAFGTQGVGITSLPNTVTVTNNLSTAVSITITPSGDFGVSTNVTNGCSNTLNGLAKCNFAVTFTPSNTGTITGVVTVTYTGSNFSPQELKLSGTGQ